MKKLFVVLGAFAIIAISSVNCDKGDNSNTNTEHNGNNGGNIGGGDIGGGDIGGGNTGGGDTGGGNTGGGSDNTPAKPSYVNGGITMTTITVNWSISPTPQNIVVEVWKPANRKWITLTTLSGSSTSHSISPYRDYIVSGNVVAGNGKDGPQGITDESDLVFVRIRGKNGTTLGPAKAVAFDAFFRDVYTDLNSVYEN